jgi:hypothetical protein
LNPELGLPAPVESVLARNASFAHEVLTKPLEIGWLGNPRDGGEFATFSGPLLSHPKPERRRGFEDGIHDDIVLGPLREFCNWDCCIKL